MLVHILGLHDVEGGLGGGSAHAVARIGTALGHALAHDVHDLLAAAVGGDGEAVADGLGKGGQVGTIAITLLSAALGHTEAGLDLVQDPQNAILIALLAQEVHITGLGIGQAEVTQHGLGDDGGHLVTIALERQLQHLGIIEGDGNDQIVQRSGNAGAGRNLDGVPAVAVGGGRRIGGVEHIVISAVIAAFQLDDLLSAGIGSGHADGIHGGFGAGVDQTNHFHRGAHIDDRLGHLHLAFAGDARRHAAVEGLDDRIVHLIIGIAQDDRTEAQSIVDVLIAVHVPHMGTLATAEVRRAALAPETAVGIHTQRHTLHGALLERIGFLQSVHGDDSPIYFDVHSILNFQGMVNQLCL